MMKTSLKLMWIKRGQSISRGFKTVGLYDIVSDYEKRSKHFIPFEIEGGLGASLTERSGVKVWFCEPSARNAVSSEDVASRLRDLRDGGVKELHILIGAADGFTAKEKEMWKPDFLWSFGSMTLPHEIAALVAAEQLYRAGTILSGHPYHQGH